MRRRLGTRSDSQPGVHRYGGNPGQLPGQARDRAYVLRRGYVGLVEDMPETHPQAEAASQPDGVHKSLPFWTVKSRLYLIEKLGLSVGNWQNHLWTA